jgi:flavin-dependent dehydrogenase
MRDVDVVIVGASLAAAAAAKRTVDAGLETVVLERKELPRHKICSGILSPRGHRFLLENFGPLPREVLHEPTSCRGVTFHFPVASKCRWIFSTAPRRTCTASIPTTGQSSAAAPRCMTRPRLPDWRIGRPRPGPCPRGGEPIEYRARQVIGADGPSSLVVRAVYPDYTKQIPWFFVGQKFHEIIDCPLSPDYFHFWFHPGLGHYTWSHARDGRQIVGVGFKRGDNFARKHQVVEAYLRDKHGVQLKPADDDHEGCAENFGPSLINRYVFGQGNVLVTGQAAGFLNMIGEGMSCALHSGAISGEAIVEAQRRNRPVQEIYRKMIASEVRRCSDQWNPLKIAFDRPHEADFPEALLKLSWRERKLVLRDMWNFIVLFKEFKWGRQIAAAALQRPLFGGYPIQKWL